jgi:hypothetical protein
VIVRAVPQGPAVLSIALRNRQVIDTRNPAAHEAVFVELPILVAVGSRPMARVVAPLVGKANCNSIVLMCPEFLDQSVVHFLAPLARQERDDGVPSGQKLGAISPNAVRGVREGHIFRVASVPRVFCLADFFCRRVGVERRERRPWFFKIIHVSALPVECAATFPQTGDAPHDRRGDA